MRIGRGAAGDKPTSNELISSSAVRELFAAPPNGEVVLAGKTLTDPALLEAMSADGFNATTDFPACLLIDDLLAACPNARVVLSVRRSGDVSVWYGFC